jgi:hypothetical protein
MLFLPESPRYLVHKGRLLDAYRVWQLLRGADSKEANREFYLMKTSVQAEEEEVHLRAVNKRMPWLDFFTCVPTSP